MKENNFALGLIRDYHSMLLNKARMIRDIKKLMRKDDFMDMDWKIGMARLFVSVEDGGKSMIKKIRELRREYNCMGF